MTIPDEAVQADKTLWCVNIKGPDDIVSAPDHLSAVRMANTFNAWWLDLVTKTPLTDNHPRMWAEPIEWPYSEGHGEDVTDPKNEYQWLRELASLPFLQGVKVAQGTGIGVLRVDDYGQFEEFECATDLHLPAGSYDLVVEPTPSPRAQALEEAARCVDAKADEYDDEAKDVRNSTDDKRLCRAIAVRLRGSAVDIRALSSQPVADHITEAGKMVAEGWLPTHRHKKRGSTYQVVAVGRLQASAPFDNERVVIYRGEDGQYWARPTYEFYDGRFEALPSSPGASE